MAGGRLPLSVAVAALAAAGWPVLPVAQDVAPGGMSLSFGITQNVQASDNPTFVADPPDGSVTSVTGLSFAYETETRLDRLRFSADTTVRATLAGEEVSSDIAEPRLSFLYARSGANADLTVRAQFRQDQIAFLRPLEDFIDDDGVFVPPDDFEDLQGQGVRQDRRLSVAFDGGGEGPLTYGLSAAVAETDYRDVTSGTLDDRRRISLGVDLAYRPLDPVSVTFGVQRIRVETDGQADRETTNLRAGVVLSRPLGALRFGTNVSSTDQGERYGITVGRDLDLPNGSLAFNLGATRSPGGDTSLTGRLAYTRQGPRSELSLTAERQVRFTDDGERLVTTLSAGYSQPLTQSLSLGLNAGLVRSETFGDAGDTATDSASLSASVGYVLTRDWSVNFGYSYRYRDSPGQEPVDENVLFVGVGRTFSFRP